MRKVVCCLALAIVTLIASAQIGSGQWKIHPYFVGGNLVNCIDASHHVYFLTNGTLFCYNKGDNVCKSLDATGDLNGGQVKQIYYDYGMGNLFITYDDCNIDIIKNDGKVVNVSAIKDVILSKEKVINDISFANGKAYVATSFGYIVIDESNFAVTEVRNYNYNVLSVSVVGEYKVMSLLNRFYYGRADKSFEILTLHDKVDQTWGNGNIIPIGDNKFFFLTASALYQVTMTATSDGKLTFEATQMPGDIPTAVQRTPSGFVASNYYNYYSGPYGMKLKNFLDYYYTCDENGDNVTKHDGAGLYSSHEPGNWWVLSTDELYHIVGGVKGEAVQPNGISISARTYWSTYDPYQQRVLLCRSSENAVMVHYDATDVTQVNSYDGSQWRDITPSFNDTYGGNFWIEVSPNEPNTYFFCFRKTGGVAKVQNDAIVARYDMTNSPVNERLVAIRFDSKGNLWMAQPRDPNIDVVAISAENQKNNQVTPSIFVTNDLGHACYSGAKGGSKRICFDIGAGDTKVYSSGDYNAPLVVWNNNDDLSLKQYKVFTTFNDQNNKQFSTYGWLCAKADNDGRMWLGTVSGIITFDPTQAFDDDFRITRHKVVKDEGKAVNEILLEGIQVNYIDVDQFNRKWVGTNTNGVYLVSADGSEIIKHFTTSNSPLPTDQIYSLTYNPNTNSVIIVTPNGVLEYINDVTPAASDYSNVYAYPNPVQSTFTGYVTIKGLMENSKVVITDANGKTVATLNSTGGIAMWDACDTNGVPVKTGVYKVYAAQQHTNTTGKPLTKIAVIK